MELSKEITEAKQKLEDSELKAAGLKLEIDNLSKQIPKESMLEVATKIMNGGLRHDASKGLLEVMEGEFKNIGANYDPMKPGEFRAFLKSLGEEYKENLKAQRSQYYYSQIRRLARYVREMDQYGSKEKRANNDSALQEDLYEIGQAVFRCTDLDLQKERATEIYRTPIKYDLMVSEVVKYAVNSLMVIHINEMRKRISNGRHSVFGPEYAADQLKNLQAAIDNHLALPAAMKTNDSAKASIKAPNHVGLEDTNLLRDRTGMTQQVIFFSDLGDELKAKINSLTPNDRNTEKIRNINSDILVLAGKVKGFMEAVAISNDERSQLRGIFKDPNSGIDDFVTKKGKELQMRVVPTPISALHAGVNSALIRYVYSASGGQLSKDDLIYSIKAPWPDWSIMLSKSYGGTWREETADSLFDYAKNIQPLLRNRQLLGQGTGAEKSDQGIDACSTLE